MKQHPDGCIDWRIFVISFVVALACACATLPPAQPIRDFKDVAGEWRGGYGTVDGWVVKIVRIINGDGTGEVISSGRHAVVTQKLVDGKIWSKNERSGETGTLTLHEGGGQRLLIWESDTSVQRIEYKPIRK
jgi:hypothetical protein